MTMAGSSCHEAISAKLNSTRIPHCAALSPKLRPAKRVYFLYNNSRNSAAVYVTCIPPTRDQGTCGKYEISKGDLLYPARGWKKLKRIRSLMKTLVQYFPTVFMFYSFSEQLFFILTMEVKNRRLKKKAEGLNAR